MAYLVRKLNKRDNIDIMGTATNLDTLYADAPTGEFRTKNGTLSTWYIDSLDSLDDAVLAMIVTSNQITRMDFVIIDTKLLDDNGLEYKQTYAGEEIAVPDLQDTHYDILGITIHKLLNCASVFREVYKLDNDQELYIVRYVEGDIKQLLNKAYSNNRIEMSRLNKGIKKGLDIAS